MILKMNQKKTLLHTVETQEEAIEEKSFTNSKDKILAQN